LTPEEYKSNKEPVD